MNNENPNSGEEVRPRTSHLMTVSIVLGVLGSIVFLGRLAMGTPDYRPPLTPWADLACLLIGPVMGIIAIARILLSRGRVKGPVSIGGFLGIGFVMALLLVIIFPAFTHGDRESRCHRNMHRLWGGLLSYADDYDHTLPPARRWNSALRPYLKSAAVFRCPQAENQMLPSYAMNSNVSGLKLKGFADSEFVVVLFDSIPGRDLCGGPELLPPKPRHPGGDDFCFADGSIIDYSRKEQSELRWEPEVVVGK